MQIERSGSSFYFQYQTQNPSSAQNVGSQPVPKNNFASQAGNFLAGETQKGDNSFPGIQLDISAEAKAAWANSVLNQNNKTTEPENSNSIPGIKAAGGPGKAAETAPTECQTCKNRRYVDGSDDPSVSFQSPTHIGPNEAGSAVRSHEYEHVAHEQAKAGKEGRRVVSQTVTIQTSICPECGRVYVSGGVTRTITASDNKDLSTPPPVDEGQEA